MTEPATDVEATVSRSAPKVQIHPTVGAKMRKIAEQWLAGAAVERSV